MGMLLRITIFLKISVMVVVMQENNRENAGRIGVGDGWESLCGRSQERRSLGQASHKRGKEGKKEGNAEIREKWVELWGGLWQDACGL